MRSFGKTCIFVVLGCSLGLGCEDRATDTGVQADAPALPTHRYLDLELVREFTILNDDEGVTVPWDKVWAIEGHTFVEGVHTDDILFEGWAELGECHFEGKFWVMFGAPQTQPLWVRGGTRIRLGDTRGELTIKEFANNTSDD
jgi:hypothetical protein